MRLGLLGFALAVTLAAGPLNHTAVTMAAERLDNRLATILPADDPVSPIGLTQGAYIPGYGVVFMSTLNLAPMAGISPFHPAVTKDEIVRIHKKKTDRLPKLKEALQELLVNVAASLEGVPPDEQVAIAVSLFYFNGEDTSGLPGQIVIHAQKKTLLGLRANAAMLGTAVKVDLF